MKQKTISLAICVFLTAAANADQNIDSMKVKRATNPIADSAGYKKYVVDLNPFAIRDFAISNRGRPLKAEPIEGLDASIQQPASWAAIKYVADKYNIKPVEAYTWSSPSFVAWLSSEQAKKIAEDEIVIGVSEDENLQTNFSAIGESTYGDQRSGDEVSSWAKVFTNTEDANTSSLPIYLIDSHLGPTKTAQPDLNIIANDAYTTGDYPQHVVHVSGVIGAKANGFGARGINPNQPIKIFAMGAAWNEAVRQVADKAMRDAETNNIFSVLNMSQNGGAGTFEHNADTPGGRKLRALSNRMLITQSAGNKMVDACETSFHYKRTGEQPQARENDGILVVGGLMRDGSKFINGPDGDPGTNTGNCVEAWAPAYEITSTKYSNYANPTNPNLLANNSTIVLSGTSFSAPMVAAIASRYGDASTRPIEREAYVRASLFNTGSYDGARPIKTIRYTLPSNHNLPKRLNISSATATTGSANLHVLYDGKFYSDVDYWVANGYYGSITFDLGSIKTITGIRATIRSSVDTTATEKAMDFAAGVGNDPSNIQESAYWTEFFQADQAPVYFSMPHSTGRYVRLNAGNLHSWVSYSEVEIYGY